MKNSYLAFFDLDETLINCKSLIEVYKAYCEAFISLDAFGKVYSQLLEMKNSYSRNEVNKWFYSNFKGIDRKGMQEIIEKWLKKSLHNLNFFNNKVVNRLKQHKKDGFHIVVISGSFFDCVTAICNSIGLIDDILCINLKTKAGSYTGEVIGVQTIGEGKVTAIEKYIANNNISLKGSYAYGDHISDLSMLHLAEHAVMVGNDKELLQQAKQNNWEII